MIWPLQNETEFLEKRKWIQGESPGESQGLRVLRTLRAALLQRKATSGVTPES